MELFFKKIRRLNISLEDLFTIFDRSILYGEDICSIQAKEVISLRDNLIFCIEYIISYHSQINSNRTYEEFSKKLIEKRIKAKMKNDRLSVLTLNWDILLDHSLYLACQEYNNGKIKNKIYPDYCFYNYSVEGLKPSTVLKSCKNYNIKLLKLHGSTNFAKCNNCGRVFTCFDSDIGLTAFIQNGKTPLIIDKLCGYCRSNGIVYSLSPLLITPTMLKDFSCLQLKNIWNNAFIDLTEATEIVFIGYSFPLADFEFRSLLKRSIKPKTKIKVILINFDNPKYYNRQLSSITDRRIKKELLSKINENLATQRYKDFFINHDITFYYKGLDKAVSSGFI